jgi:hypothetical protein
MTPHASARALILLTGWYLVYPPVSKDGGHWSFNLRAPVAKWLVANHFASSEDCEAYRFPYLDHMRAAVVQLDHSDHPSSGMGRAVAEAKSQAVCDQR